jgi:Nucleotidyl transferase AbiEii toxin, Type IV TA system
VLSPLQEQIATLVAGLDEAKDFALAGGAALITRGDVDRSTRDLDFFGLTPDDVDRLAPVVIRALVDLGLEVRTVQENPGFVRLEVSSSSDTTELDLAADARILPVEHGSLVPTLAGEELATDKVLAVFGRAEARDFVDLRAVESRYGLRRLCERAAEKDPGFSIEVFNDMLNRFSRLRRDEFELDDSEFADLSNVVEEWRHRVLELDHEQTPERRKGRDTGLRL